MNLLFCIVVSYFLNNHKPYYIQSFFDFQALSCTKLYTIPQNIFFHYLLVDFAFMYYNDSHTQRLPYINSQEVSSIEKRKHEQNKEPARRQNMWKAVKMELRQHKSSFAVYIVLRALVILVMILQIMNQNYENVFLCILTLLLLFIPSFIQVNFKIELPTTLEIIVLLFIFPRNPGRDQ